MGDDSLIIIGAGLAGLSTGVFAQLNGYRSQIFEHHSQPGGVAATWRRGEYLIDGGIHFVMGHRPGSKLYELYRQLGLLAGNRFQDLETYGRFVDETSGATATLSGNLDQMAVALTALSPADKGLVDDLLAGVRLLRGVDMSELGLGKPPELSGPLDQLRDLWAMRRLVRLFTGRYSQSVREYVRAVQERPLKLCLQNLFMPGVPVYFVQMLLALLADRQLGLIEGGCRDLVGAFERRYCDLGGRVTYHARVEEIPVEGGRAVGVRLADGSEHRAGAVVSAADGRSTLFGMLGGRYLTDRIRQRYETWPRFKPLLMINFGVARTFPDQPPFVTIALERPLRVGRQDEHLVFIRLFNYSDRFAPAGKTVVQVEFETEWDYWADLQQADRARYEAEKATLTASVLERLERHYPGITGQVELTDVATPYTWWRYTLNDRGAWEGWLMTAEVMRTTVERTLPGLERFYMAGQWVMPGGGVPPVLYSGRHAVQLLCRDDRRPFRFEG